MGHQAGFNLERRHVNAANLEHVVTAAAVGVVAVSVQRVFVAAFGPVASKGGFCLGAVVPVHDGRRGAADVQLAYVADRAVFAVVADDSQLIAGHGLAGGAVAHRTRPVA